MSESAGELYIPERLVPGVELNLPEHPTNLKFVFGFHQFPADLPQTVEGQVGNPDLLLVEQVNYIPDFETLFNTISEAPDDVVEEMRMAFSSAGWYFGRQVELVAAAKPERVGIADLPYGHEAAEPMAKILNDSEEAMRRKAGMSRTVEQMIKRVRSHMDKDLEVYATREKFIAEDIYSRLGAIASELDRPIEATYVVGADHICLVGLLRLKVAEAGQADTHQIEYELVEDDLPLHPLTAIRKSFYKGEEITDDHIAEYILHSLVPAVRKETYAETIRSHERMIKDRLDAHDSVARLSLITGKPIN